VVRRKSEWVLHRTQGPRCQPRDDALLPGTPETESRIPQLNTRSPPIHSEDWRATIGLDVHEGELRYCFLNKLYEEWFPRRREDLQGRLVREVIGEKAFAAVRDYIERALAGERLSFEQFMPYKEGQPRHIRTEYVPTNLNNLIVEFGEMLENSVGPQIEVQLNLRPRVPPALVDPVHLEMAVLNVLINARDAMPKGGCVTIGTSKVHLNGNVPAHHLPPGDYVALTISDEGEGMPPHVLERTTEPFFTTKSQGKGTGLGLAMVHGFVQQSLGRLEIDSERSKGTTIRMLFPSAEAQAQAPRQPDRDLAHVEPRGQAETILVVEDSNDVLDLAREHLTALGYNVLTARDADEALAVFHRAEGRIDLLFTDLVMLGSMNGLALADAVRERQPGIGVLLTTGYNDDLLTAGKASAGADVLGKPYRRSELADRIRAALNGRGRERQVPQAGSLPGPRHEG
jgi:CheY-like chemotaxis protein